MKHLFFLFIVISLISCGGGSSSENSSSNPAPGPVEPTPISLEENEEIVTSLALSHSLAESTIQLGQAAVNTILTFEDSSSTEINCDNQTGTGTAQVSWHDRDSNYVISSNDVFELDYYNCELIVTQDKIQGLLTFTIHAIELSDTLTMVNGELTINDNFRIYDPETTIIPTGNFTYRYEVNHQENSELAISQGQGNQHLSINIEGLTERLNEFYVSTEFDDSGSENNVVFSMEYSSDLLNDHYNCERQLITECSDTTGKTIRFIKPYVALEFDLEGNGSFLTADFYIRDYSSFLEDVLFRQSRLFNIIRPSYVEDIHGKKIILPSADIAYQKFLDRLLVLYKSDGLDPNTLYEINNETLALDHLLELPIGFSHIRTTTTDTTIYLWNDDNNIYQYSGETLTLQNTYNIQHTIVDVRINPANTSEIAVIFLDPLTQKADVKIFNNGAERPFSLWDTNLEKIEEDDILYGRGLQSVVFTQDGNHLIASYQHKGGGSTGLLHTPLSPNGIHSAQIHLKGTRMKGQLHVLDNHLLADETNIIRDSENLILLGQRYSSDKTNFVSGFKDRFLIKHNKTNYSTIDISSSENYSLLTRVEISDTDIIKIEAGNNLALIQQENALKVFSVDYLQPNFDTSCQRETLETDELITIEKLTCSHSDVIYDSQHQKIYAAIDIERGETGHSIASIDHELFEAEQYIPIKGQPLHLALSSSQNYLYVSKETSSQLIRIDLTSSTYPKSTIHLPIITPHPDKPWEEYAEYEVKHIHTSQAESDFIALLGEEYRSPCSKFSLIGFARDGISIDAKIIIEDSELCSSGENWFFSDSGNFFIDLEIDFNPNHLTEYEITPFEAKQVSSMPFEPLGNKYHYNDNIYSYDGQVRDLNTGASLNGFNVTVPDVGFISYYGLTIDELANEIYYLTKFTSGNFVLIERFDLTTNEKLGEFSFKDTHPFLFRPQYLTSARIFSTHDSIVLSDSQRLYKILKTDIN